MHSLVIARATIRIYAITIEIPIEYGTPPACHNELPVSRAWNGVRVSVHRFTTQIFSKLPRVEAADTASLSKSDDSKGPERERVNDPQSAPVVVRSVWRRLVTRLRVDDRIESPTTESERPKLLDLPSAPPSVGAVEMRVVEQMLQSLASVEAKLERSHVDLMGRSDEIERRLTILWDLEERLEGIQHSQKSFLDVMERQHFVESAVLSQYRTLRYFVAIVSFALGTTIGFLVLRP